MYLTTQIRPNKLILSILLTILLITAVVIGFSAKADAKSTQSRSTLHDAQKEWIYVENGRVYYFDDNGILCYKQLKDAQLRFNY